MLIKLYTLLYLCFFVTIVFPQASFISQQPANGKVPWNGNPIDFASNDAYTIILNSKTKDLSIIKSNSEQRIQIDYCELDKIKLSPSAIEIDKFNNVYVLDTKQKKIFVTDVTGKSFFNFGKDDGNIGSFSNPVKMAIDKNGVLYIVDKGFQKILIFSSAGLFEGETKVSNPIDLSIASNGDIYVLAFNKKKPVVIIYSNQFTVKNIIGLNSLEAPNSISTNAYGEFYITDLAQGKIFHFLKDGTSVGSPIGNKSRAKSPGNFSSPTTVSVNSLDSENDIIKVLDTDFNTIQQFKIQTPYKRELLPTKEPLIRFKKLNEGIVNYSDYFQASSGTSFLVSSDEVKIKKGRKDLLAIEKVFTGNVVGCEEISSNYYIITKKPCTISKFNQKGIIDNKFKQLEVPELTDSEISCIASDGKSKLFIADKEENKIWIYDLLNKSASSINCRGFGTIVDPIGLEFSNNKLYILCSSKNELFVYDIAAKKITQILLEIDTQELEFTSIAVSNNNSIFISDGLSGVIYLIQNGFIVKKFHANSVSQFTTSFITKLAYNNENSVLTLWDGESRIVEEIKIDFANEKKLLIAINDMGFSELKWQGVQNVTIFQAELNNKKTSILDAVTDSSYILVNNSNNLLSYSVKLENGKMSNIVVDKFSFAKSIEKSKPNISLDMLKSVRELNPQIVDSEIKKVYRFLIEKNKVKKNYSKAIDELFELQKYSPNSFVLYIERSQLYLKLNKSDLAIEQLKTADSKFPGNREIILQLGRMLYQNRLYKEVIEYVNNSMKKYPGDIELMELLASSSLSSLNFSKSILYYSMLSEKTNDIKYKLKIADIYILDNKVEKAVSTYDSIPLTEENAPSIIAAKARLNIKLGKKDLAIKELTDANEKYTNNEKIKFELAKIYSESDLNKALTYLNNVLSTNDENVEALILQGILYTKLKKYDAAAFSFESAMILDENNLDAIIRLAENYLVVGKVDYSFGLYQKAIMLSPNDNKLLADFEKVQEARKLKNKSRNPIEFNFFDLGEITESLINYYKDNPFGYVTIYNTRNFAIKNIVLHVNNKTICNSESIITLDEIAPNEYKEIAIKLNLKENLINSIKIDKVDLNFNLIYYYDNLEIHSKEIKAIPILR